MSLPPGFLDELRNRLSLAQVVARKVTYDMRKSNQGKGDYWAPCPFHQEKSASFHVDDRKGFYYCFGCQAKGDAVKFVMETENAGFLEAVEILAREAGMPMPERDARAAQVADRRSKLAEAVEAAIQHFRLMLKGGGGAAARDYLARRKLSEAAQERWQLGFAPDHRSGLLQALTAKGFDQPCLVEAGLILQPEDGGTPYDRFRGRVIFPIRDARGRAISLGGRALDPNARAKYLNGPETPLFDKGRSLFNHGPAREAAGKGQVLVVAEGYMDVIALSEAGFRATVAPLGTAVTAEQLHLMWRIHDEPVIALDGDAAGIRAALRVIDLALPLLEAGKGLRFAILPQGQDPDDLIKAEGPPGFQRVLDAAQPMARLLWQRETEGKIFDSPERRATLDKSLREALKRITDPSIRAHYGEEMRRLREELFGTANRGGRDFGFREGPARDFGPRMAQGSAGRRGAGGKFPPQQIAPAASTKASLLGSAGSAVEDRMREAVILAVLATRPDMIARHESRLERMACDDELHQTIRQALFRASGEERGGEIIRGHAGEELESLLALPHVQIVPALRSPDDDAKVLQCLAEEFTKLEARRAARREIADAVEEVEALVDEGLTWRLGQAAEAVNRAGRAQNEDTGDLGEDRSALSSYLQQLIDGQVWVKKPR